MNKSLKRANDWKKVGDNMQGIKSRIKTRSGRQSVFFRTWMILLLLFAVLILCFQVIVNRINSGNHRRQVQAMNLELLKQTGDLAELSLHMLQADVNQLLWNQLVTEYIINPGEENQKLEYQILQQLENTTNTSDLIREIWLYSAVDDRILCSDGNAVQKELFKDQEIMESHKVNREASFSAVDDHIQELLVVENRMFWVQDLFLARHVASLYMEIDVSALYELLGILDSEMATYIYRENGQLLIPRDLLGEAPETMDFQKKKLFLTSSEPKDYENQKWYCVRSDTLGWYFVRKLDSSALKWDWKKGLSWMLPGICLFIGIGILGCYWITRQIYQPINHLIQLVLQTQDKEKTGLHIGNEVDYLKETYFETLDEKKNLELSFFRTLDEKKTLELTMDRFSRDILEQAFRKLLLGKNPQECGFTEMEDQWKKGWVSGSCYQVLACLKIEEVQTIAAALDAQLYYRSVCQVLESMKSPLLHLEIQMESNLIAILVCGSDQISSGEFIYQVQAMEEHLIHSFAPSAYPIHVSHGKIYSGMEDLIYSWQEARQSAQYQLYMEKSFPNGEKKQPIQQQMEDLNREMNRERHYQERARHILDHVMAGRKKEAFQLVTRVLDDMMKEKFTKEEMLQQYNNMSAVFIERYVLVCGKKHREDVIGGQLESFKTVEEMKAAMERELRELVQEIWMGTQKSTYRYVEIALQYMHENYHNSSLGIQEVADYVHIHSTYLSKIFNELQGESFTSWLNKLRVEKAKELLLQTDMPVKDIGFHCGFNTVQSFNRVFKKVAQETPSEYRKKKC